MLGTMDIIRLNGSEGPGILAGFEEVYRYA